MEKDNNRVEEPIASYNEPLSFEKVWKMFQETDKQFKETDKRFQETDKKLNKLEQLFTSQWGKLIESLVEGDLINLLKARGIEVYETSERVKGNRDGENFEFDIIAHNGNEIVIVEVKTTLRPDDVKEFSKTLKKAKIYLPKYSDNTIIGAMAYLTADGHADRMAEKKGFFVIRATGNSAAIVNQKDFEPRKF